MLFLVSGGLSEGARPFPLKIFDTKIPVNSTSGECISWSCWTKQLEIVYIKGDSILDTLIENVQK